MGHLSYNKEDVKHPSSTTGPRRSQCGLLAHHRRGLPEHLRLVMESLAGLSLRDVQVQYHSAKPARLGARAYAQGNQIYLGPGQEAHLAHELWHVVQQKQGRVTPTAYVQGQAVNDDPRLEQEAIRMGTLALHLLATGAFPRGRQRSLTLPDRSLALPETTSAPVIQFTLEDAITYAKKELGAPGNADKAWIEAYLNDSNNPIDKQEALLKEVEKPERLKIPSRLRSYSAQATQTPVVDNNNFATWKDVSNAARTTPAPTLGLGGVAPATYLRTQLVNVTDPVFTQLNPQSSGNIDVKSTAYANLLHTHQNMAAKTGLNKPTTLEGKNTARNIMRTVKRTSVQGSGTKKQKPLVEISTDPDENAKIWNVATAFAAELGITETRHGGAAAIAQAMATLYVIKHGGKIQWKDKFYGTGTGGGKDLGQLQARNRAALNAAYKDLAARLKDIFEENHESEEHNRQELEGWLTAKFKSWTTGYETGFDATDEVNVLLDQIVEEDKKYRPPVKKSAPKKEAKKHKLPVKKSTSKAAAKKRRSVSDSDSGEDSESGTSEPKKKQRSLSRSDSGDNSVADSSDSEKKQSKKKSKGVKRERSSSAKTPQTKRFRKKSK